MEGVTIMMVRVMIIAVLAALLGACGATQPPIVVSEAWARPTSDGAMGGDDMHGMGMSSAIYLKIASNAGEDRLTGATSTVSDTIETHNVENADGVMKMFKVDGIPVPANGTVELKPGSYHLMLLNMAEPLAVGDTFTATLQFANAGAIEVEVTVRMP
jgi:copper(I)-binding protein